MKKINSLKFILSLALVFLMPVQLMAKAEFDYGSMTAIEWQTVKLQESIERKIIKSLSPVIKEDEYIIEVKIGVDKEAGEAPSPKQVTTTKQAKKVKFSTSENSKDGDDYVVFNKLGLEAPSVGEEPAEIKTSEAELGQKAFIEMNDRFNLFKYLKTIDINLTFDKGLPPKTKEVIKKVVQGLSFNISDVVPQINIQYLELKASRIKPDNDLMARIENAPPQKEQKKWFENFKNLDVMFGIILAATIIAVALYLISRKNSKSGGSPGASAGAESAGGAGPQSSGASASGPGGFDPQGSTPEGEPKVGDPLAETDPNSGLGRALLEEMEEEEEEEVLEDELIPVEDEDMKLDLTKTDPQTMRINEGLERLRKVLANHYQQTMLMIKGWIKSGKPNDQLALRSMVQVLTDAELADIFKSLTIDERGGWRSCLGEEMEKEEIAKSFIYISQKVMEMMMVPSLIDDYEVCDLLLDVTAEDAARYCKENIQLGVIFTNVLTSRTISEMFKLLPDDVAEKLIMASASFIKEELTTKLPLLKEKLVEVKRTRDKPPFITRIFDILPTAKQELERSLYASLLKHMYIDDVKLVALKIFPAELTGKLPDSVFKNVISMMPLETQVQYFASFDKDERAIVMNRFASKGSKNREMLEVEINTIAKNEIALRRLQNERKAAIEHEFLNYTRQLISTNVDAQRDVIDEVEIWLTEIKETTRNTVTKVNTKAA